MYKLMSSQGISEQTELLFCAQEREEKNMQDQ